MRKHRYCFLMLILGLALILVGCKKRNHKQVTASPSPASVEEENHFTAIVKAIDQAGSRLTVVLAGTQQELVYPYSGATHFLSLGKQELSPSQIEVGEAVELTCNNQELASVEISSEVERVTDVTGITVRSQDNYIEARENKYRYNKGVVVASNNQKIDIMEVTAMDTVTMIYREGTLYSLRVTKGHGYIRPTNYADFVGGTMTVDGETILPVSNQMLVTVPEGTYKVTMKNGDFTGERKTTVERDQEVKLDMSIFKSQPSNVGQVDFEITPEGAEVYVNGSLVNVKKPVSLKYGEHQVVVRLEGYSDYEGTLDVESPNPTVKINLAKETAQVDQDDTSTVKEETTSTTQTNMIDHDHKITVKEPAGASVYLNGAYKGISPCSFDKEIGTQTITLSQSGYTTKSYSVTITNDGKDISWSFPALVKEETK